jgi:large subunit GTPase 1
MCTHSYVFVDRCQWADYFDAQGIHYAFFSAANAVALQLARREAAEAQLRSEELEQDSDELEKEESEEEGDENIYSPPESPRKSHHTEEASSNNDTKSQTDSLHSHHDDAYFSAEENTPKDHDPRATVLSVLELEELFLRMAPDLSGRRLYVCFRWAYSFTLPAFTDSSGQPPTRFVVGLVGYPNVGKSSTINSLLGEKKVSVSSTPGKTKHFQTIHLSDAIVLCDCPGLVFPQFATTKAELVCDGVLPIDQMREYTGPISLIVKRIPTDVLQAIYGLVVKVRGIEEGGDGKITAENFLISYASKSIRQS